MKALYRFTQASAGDRVLMVVAGVMLFFFTLAFLILVLPAFWSFVLILMVLPRLLAELQSADHHAIWGIIWVWGAFMLSVRNFYASLRAIKDPSRGKVSWLVTNFVAGAITCPWVWGAV